MGQPVRFEAELHLSYMLSTHKANDTRKISHITI